MDLREESKKKGKFMFCQKCGKNVPDDTKFCPKCGASTATDSAIQPEVTGASEVIPSNFAFGIIVAAFSSLFCCGIGLPFGIMSIVQASKVSGLVNAGCVSEAKAAV